MNRRHFINKLVRWSLLVFLAGLSLILSKKVIIKKDCSSCPDYSSCPGIDRCEIISSNS